jgi:hypothetical protein
MVNASGDTKSSTEASSPPCEATAPPSLLPGVLPKITQSPSFNMAVRRIGVLEHFSQLLLIEETYPAQSFSLARPVIKSALTPRRNIDQIVSDLNSTVFESHIQFLA